MGRLALAEPAVPFAKLTELSLKDGLRNLQTLVLFGEATVEDGYLAALLSALLRRSHSIRELDLRASHAGSETLAVLVERLETSQACSLNTVYLEGTPAAGSQCASLRARLDGFLHSRSH